MKIVLSGLPATGKTTLGIELAATLNVPFATEAAARLASLGAHVGPAMTCETLSAIMLVQMARELALAGDFVADRGPLDMLAYARLIRQDVTDGASDLISFAIEALAVNWLERARYDLVVYHEVLCGPRGEELQRRRSEYLRRLADCFEAVISEQRPNLPNLLRVPGDLTVAERCALITSALAQPPAR